MAKIHRGLDGAAHALKSALLKSCTAAGQQPTKLHMKFSGRFLRNPCIAGTRPRLERLATKQRHRDG